VSRRQRLTLAAAILGSAVVAIDGSIVNIALPAIERDLGGGLSAQQWVSNAYLLTLGSLILIGGSLGDIYGERRVFASGAAAFGVLSLACALAPTIGVLIAARALQGAAGALVTPSSLAIIVAAFAPRERMAAVGSWTAWGGIAAVIGPLAGGAVGGPGKEEPQRLRRRAPREGLRAHAIDHSGDGPVRRESPREEGSDRSFPPDALSDDEEEIRGIRRTVEPVPEEREIVRRERLPGDRFRRMRAENVEKAAHVLQDLVDTAVGERGRDPAGDLPVLAIRVAADERDRIGARRMLVTAIQAFEGLAKVALPAGAD